jgi:hypothetical protein
VTGLLEVEQTLQASILKDESERSKARGQRQDVHHDRLERHFLGGGLRLPDRGNRVTDGVLDIFRAARRPRRNGTPKRLAARRRALCLLRRVKPLVLNALYA